MLDKQIFKLDFPSANCLIGMPSPSLKNFTGTIIGKVGKCINFFGY